MVEQYFRTSSYKIALGRFKKKFKEMPDSKTIQRVVERFQTAYTLEDEPRSRRPHTLSDDDQTELREHMEEHPGMSTCRAVQQARNSAEDIERRRLFSLPHISVARIKTRRLLSTLRLFDWFFNKFGRNVETLSTIFFFQMKRGFICLDM